MAGEYNINLSNGTVLSTLYPLETNGPDNRSVPRQIMDVRPQYQITLVTGAPGAGTISIVGDFTNVFRIGQLFEITGSTSNNGTYTVAAVTFSVGNTQITTVENLTDNTADGVLIAHVFILNGDLTYRFVPSFNFNVQESHGPLISNVDTVAETFTVAGDYTYYFINGTTFTVINSTGNDGTYTTTSSTYLNGETTITVVENITDPTIDGKIEGLINGTYTVTSLGSVVDGTNTIIPVTHGSIRDNLINTIALPYGQVEYTIFDNNSSLKLPGKGTINYGEMIIENLVRMTENFANDIAPELNTNIGSNPAGNPLVGQLWYKTLASEEGFQYYDGIAWSNQWDYDNGTIIFRDPQNTTTANSDIYLTGDETQLPAGYTGTVESGMVIWNEVDPIAQDSILRVLSTDGAERLRVEHDGYIRTVNNLEVIGGGNGTSESYFYGQVGIGNNGLPTVERTLTVEGTGISVNSDTGLNAGIVLDCPSITEQSIIEFEVANVPISSIHTETSLGTTWESYSQTTNDVTALTIRGGNTVSGANAGSVNITGGTNGGGNTLQNAGNVTITGGESTDGYAGKVIITGGETVGTYTGNINDGGQVLISGGDFNVNHTPLNGSQSDVGNVEIKGGDTLVGSALSGSIYLTGGNSNDNQYSEAGNIRISGGTSFDSSGLNNGSGKVEILTNSTNVNGGYGNTGNILLQTGDGSKNGNSTGSVTLITGSGDYVGGINLTVGSSIGTTATSGGDVNITAGDRNSSGGGKGGDVILTVGSGTNAAVDGTVKITGNVDINGSIPTGTVDLSVKGDILTETVFVGGDGSITNPTYSFINDPNTGIFSAGSDQIGFVVNGTNVLDINPSGLINVNTASYESLVLNNNDIPNKKFVDDRIAEYDTLAELNDVNITTPTDDEVLTYSSGTWINKAIIPRYEEYTAVGGETVVNTTISVLPNTGNPGVSYIQVFLNGILQIEGATKSYQVTGATQLTFNVALVANDNVVIYSFA